MKLAADAGDAMSAAFYARMAAEGIAMPAPDGKLADTYLRKAASAGLTSAQVVLGRWLIAQYQKGLIGDLKEPSDLFLKAYQQGHDIQALNDLTHLHTSAAKAAPWQDFKKGFAFARQCSGFSEATCHYNTALGWQHGHYGAPNILLAGAHFAIASSLGYEKAAPEQQRLYGVMTAADRERSSQLEAAIRAALKPIPVTIALQYPDVPSPQPPSAIALDRLPGSGFQTPTAPQHTQPQQQMPVASGQTAPAASAGTPDMKACRASATEPAQRFQACTRVIQATASSNAEIAEAHNWRGDVRMNSLQYNEAFADYAEAAQRAPGNAVYLYDRGRAQLSRGNLKLALDDYDASLRINGAYVLALAGRAETLRRLDNIPDATSSANAALQIEPRNLYALSVRGDVLADAGRLAEAMQDFQLATSITDHSGYPHFRLAGLLFNANRFTEALSQIDQATGEHNGREARFFILKARIQAALRNFSGADDTLSKVIELEPNNSIAYQWRGALRFAEWSAVTEWCKGGRRGQPPTTQALSFETIGGNGNSLCTSPQSVEPALKDLNMAITKDPNNSEAHFQMARVLTAIKNLTAAVSAYTAVIRIKPSSAAHGNRAGLYEELGQPELAIGDFNEAIRLDPKNKFAWAGRASFLSKRNRQQAISDYRRALDIDGNYSYAINGLRQLGVRP